ncbi:MAG: hypothetical protein ACLPWS_13780 [Rhodomicrobium sp.]
MATITHVFTVARVARMLGVSEETIKELAEPMDFEDGYLLVYSLDEHAVRAFTDMGIENLMQSLRDRQ